MPTVSRTNPRVFVSYDTQSDRASDLAHALSYRLRRDGVDARAAVYETNPERGWPAWREEQIANADFVLVVCTPAYRRAFDDTSAVGDLEIKAEARLLRQRVTEEPMFISRILPVCRWGSKADAVPLMLRGSTSFPMTVEAEYEPLRRVLVDEPLNPLPPMGGRKPPRDPKEPPPLFPDASEEPSSRSRPAQPPSHTAIVLDRTHAWRSLNEACSTAKGNRAFIIHGSWQQDLELFMERITTYFHDPEQCSQLHHVVSVGAQRDFSECVTGEDWAYVTASATRARQLPLEHALEDEALERPVLLLLSAGGPLRELQSDQRDGLMEFLSDVLPVALERAAPRHPIHVIVPVEDSPTLAEQLQETLYEAGPALRLEAPIRLEFPDWMEIRDHLTQAFTRRGLEPDGEAIRRCRDRYWALMMQQPRPRLRTLADELHTLIQDLIRRAKRRRR